jgi:hypothetical protein
MSIRRRSELLVLALLVGAPLARAEGVTAPAPAQSQADVEQYREAFKKGYEKYTEGAFGEAIGLWDPIYRELGPKRGYRLAFNLARAHEKVSDFVLAGERYEAFLDEVDARRKAGEVLDAIVEMEAKEAEERIDELRATRGRIKVIPGAQPLEARLDARPRRAAGFTAYVSPGEHEIAFLSGDKTIDTQKVTVDAGQIVEVAPPPSAEEPKPARAESPRETRLETVRPFSPLVLYVGAGMTAASFVLPVILYVNASNLVDQLRSEEPPNASANAQYSNARNAAYASWALPIGLGAVTAGLAAWYFAGAKERLVVLRPGVGGASVSGQF